jgi:hypothetical protein
MIRMGTARPTTYLQSRGILLAQRTGPTARWRRSSVVQPFAAAERPTLRITAHVPAVAENRNFPSFRVGDLQRPESHELQRGGPITRRSTTHFRQDPVRPATRVIMQRRAEVRTSNVRRCRARGARPRRAPVMRFWPSPARCSPTLVAGLVAQAPASPPSRRTQASAGVADVRTGISTTRSRHALATIDSARPRVGRCTRADSHRLPADYPSIRSCSRAEPASPPAHSVLARLSQPTTTRVFFFGVRRNRF